MLISFFFFIHVDVLYIHTIRATLHPFRRINWLYTQTHKHFSRKKKQKKTNYFTFVGYVPKMFSFYSLFHCHYYSMCLIDEFKMIFLSLSRSLLLSFEYEHITGPSRVKANCYASSSSVATAVVVIVFTVVVFLSYFSSVVKGT